MGAALSVIVEIVVSILIIAIIVLVCYCCCCKKRKPPIPDKPKYVPLVKDPLLTEITSVDSSTNGVYRYVMEGGWYEGPLVNGVMQGEGKFCYANDGGNYVGGFKNNTRDGKGVFSAPKECFEGTYVNDIGTEGTYWSPDNFRQRGHFEGQYKLNGHGIMVTSQRRVMEGEFLNDMANGSMKVHFLESGNKFDGEIYQIVTETGTTVRGEGSMWVEGKWKYNGGLSCSKYSYTQRVRVWDRNESGKMYYDPV